MVDRFANRTWAKANWFVLLLPGLLLFEWAFARSNDWSDAGLSEPAMLFDLCLVIPALFVLCYRKTLPPSQLALRAMALSCLGIYVASKLVPADAQTLLPHLYWPRMAGLAVLVLIELKLFVAVMKLVFARGSTAEQVAERTGAPAWIVRLMLLEARFWQAVWRFIRGR